MRIVNHRLADVPFREANCFGKRLHAATLIVVHDTAGSLRPFSSVEWFENASCGTSAHVVVERDGTATQMVPFDMAAFHAGKSVWGGKTGVNAFGLGIEIVNPGMMVRRGDEALLIYKADNGSEKIVERFPITDCVEVDTPEHGHGWCLPYTDAQLVAVTDLCKTLAYTYPSIIGIVTHWMVSPKRKVDTTPLFPLQELHDTVFNRPTPSRIIEAAKTAPGPAAAAKAGLFDGLSFSKISELADEGSRVATKIQQVKRWFWGGTIATGTAAASVDTTKGTGAVLKMLVAEHPLLVLAVVVAVIGAAAWCGFKLIEKYLVTAANEGRYTPRGGGQ